jgi:hypothetical protein
MDTLAIFVVLLMFATVFFASVAFFGWAVGFWVLGGILALMLLTWGLARVLL